MIDQGARQSRHRAEQRTKIPAAPDLSLQQQAGGVPARQCQQLLARCSKPEPTFLSLMGRNSESLGGTSALDQKSAQVFQWSSDTGNQSSRQVFCQSGEPGVASDSRWKICECQRLVLVTDVLCDAVQSSMWSSTFRNNRLRAEVEDRTSVIRVATTWWLQRFRIKHCFHLKGRNKLISGS